MDKVTKRQNVSAKDQIKRFLFDRASRPYYVQRERKGKIRNHEMKTVVEGVIIITFLIFGSFQKRRISSIQLFLHYVKITLDNIPIRFPQVE